MSIDLVTLSILVQELKTKLIMGKILKVNQPENDEIRLNIRNNGENYILVMSSNPNNPHINLTSSKKVNPTVCPNFCMLLRKYLTNSILKNIDLENKDRIIKLTFESKDELKYTKIFNIYVELINRYSNIIFTNENDIILNSIRQIPFDNNQKRPIVNGLKYEYLPQNMKPCIFDLASNLDVFNNYDGQKLQDFLLGNFSGLSKQTLYTILNYVNLYNSTSIETNKINSLVKILNQFQNGEICEKLNYYSDSKGYYFSFEKLNIMQFSLFNEAIDYSTTNQDKNCRLKDRTKKYYNLLNKYITKTEKKIKLNEEKLVECANRDIYKLKGELLTSNIYLLKRGQTQIEVENYYDNYNIISIKLDEKLSPKDNIQHYYKKYSKLKNAEEITKKQLEQNKLNLEYATSILSDLDNIKYEDNLDDIFEELESLNIIKPHNKKKINNQTLITYEIDGYTIIAGKNNIQNDYITFKLANSKDMWCHTKNSHGTHVIVFRKDGIIEDYILDIALQIAAFYSNNKSAKVEVDYTERKNVSRKDNKHKGLVYYTNYKTKLVIANNYEQYLVK